MGQTIDAVVTAVEHYGVYFSFEQYQLLVLVSDAGIAAEVGLQDVYEVGRRFPVTVVKHAEGTLYRACHPDATPVGAPPEFYRITSCPDAE